MYRAPGEVKGILEPRDALLLKRMGKMLYRGFWRTKVKRTRHTTYYLAGLVSLATFLVYLAALHNNFVDWDDDSYVFENPYSPSFNFSFFRWAFLKFYSGNWHPLTWVSHALDYALWGLNPLGHHLTNIVLHAINAFLVVFLVIRLLEVWKEKTVRNGSPSFLNERTMLIAAGVTGLLFGLHPLHVESVAWVSERKDLLCALFFLLSIITYAKYAHGVDEERTQKKLVSLFFNKQYLFAVGLFVLALLSKPMAVTLPIILLLLDWHPFNRIRSFKTFRTVCIEKLPFMILSLFSSIVTILAQNAGGAIQSLKAVPLSARMLIAAESLVAYLGKMAVPFNLVPYYPYPKNVSLLSPESLLSIAFITGITAACLIVAKKQKLWLLAWGYYVVTLIPVLGIVQVGAQSMADRYTYLPSLGPFFIIGLGAAWVWRTVAALKMPGLHIKVVCSAAAIFVFVSLSLLTVKQIGIWKNSFTLWSYVIEKEPGRVPIAYTYRGAAFEKAGQLDNALKDYERAIALNPYDHTVFSNMGTLFGKLNLFSRSIEYFNKAIALAPDYADAYFNRGITYVAMDQFGPGLEDFNRAILLNPNDATAYWERGNLHLKMGSKVLATADFRTACDLGYEKGCNALR
jgi:regulator of sirC expression with transglutaminase-like and TPR domain